MAASATGGTGGGRPLHGGEGGGRPRARLRGLARRRRALQIGITKRVKSETKQEVTRMGGKGDIRGEIMVISPFSDISFFFEITCATKIPFSVEIRRCGVISVFNVYSLRLEFIL